MINDEKHGGLLPEQLDDRDYKASHILGSNDDIPAKIDLRCVKPMNQGSTSHCTSYGITMVHSILQTMEHGKEKQLDPEEQWNNQLIYPGTAKEGVGDYLRSALRALKRYGLSNPDPEKPLQYHIKGYALIENTSEDFCKYLAQGFPIYTGGLVTKTNFKNAKLTGYWTGKDNPEIGGHAFMVVAYDKDKKEVTVINSWGEKWGYYKDGTFKIKFNNIKDLFSSYIIYDKKDIKMIYKDVSEDSPMADAIKFCLENGYIRGYGDAIDAKDRYFKPDKPVTRAEMAQILYNIRK